MAKEQQRCMMPREITVWYKNLPMEDQREISKAVQKWHDKQLGVVTPGEKKDG